MSATQVPGPLASNGIPLAIWNLPALAPPKGRVPNFDHPETKNREIIILNSVFLALMFVAVIMRFSVRQPREKRMTWDGVMCIIAVLGSIAHSALMLSCLSIGYGKHMWEIRAVTLTRAKLLQASHMTIPYNIGICFGKLSVLVLYLRLFQIMATTRYLICFGITLTVASCIAFLAIGVAQSQQCVTISAFTTSSWCDQMPKIVVIQVAINVFIDFYIIAIPLQQVCKMHLDTRRKLGVAAIFSVGFFACLISVVRLAFSVLHMNVTDQWWFAILTSELSIVEMNVVIIAPCLLFLPPFITMIKSRLSSLGSKFRNGGRSSTSKGSNEGNLGKKSSDAYLPDKRSDASFEGDFITRPDSHAARSATPTSPSHPAKRRDSDVYGPVV